MNSWVNLLKDKRLISFSIYFLIVWTVFELYLIKDLKLLPSKFLYVDELVLVIIFLIAFLPVVLRQKKFRRTPIDILVGIFATIGIISMLVNGSSPIVGIMGMRAVLQYLLLYYALVNLEIDEKVIINSIRLIFTLAITQIGLGLYQIIFKVPTPARELTLHLRKGIRYGEELRAFGSMLNPNTLAVFLVFVLILIFSFLLFKLMIVSKKQLIYLGIFSSSVLFLTFSRQSIGGLLVVIFIGNFLYLKDKGFFKFKVNFRKYLIIAFLVIVVSSFSYFALLKFLPGFEDRNQNTVDLSSNYRVMMLQAGWEVFKTSPIIGVGPGAFGSSAAFYYGSPWHEYIKVPVKMNTSDSNVLTLLVETGILGLLAFLGVLAVMAKASYTYMKKYQEGFWTSLSFSSLLFVILFALVAMVSSAWENHQIAFYVWLVFGFIVSKDISKIEERRDQHERSED